MDISIILYTVLALIGQGISWLVASNYKKLQHKVKQLKEHEEIIAELHVAKQQIALNKQLHEKCRLLSIELNNLRNINTSLEADLREATIQLESTKIHAENKIRQIDNNEQHLSEKLENLANRIFEQNNRQVYEQTNQNLNNLLRPLREQLDNFRRQIQDNFSQEALERRTLSYEIRNFQQLNSQIAQEAINLTRALKGDNKTQGNWGEVILTRVMEASGLREGYEYETQVSIKNNAHSRMQPDVIVHLSQGNDVIIDAKVSLIAYERYFNSEDEQIQELALQEHISSVRNHIRQLGRKDYQQLPGLYTLDYVLMFIPIEPAFLLAINKQPELINEALHNNIMLVSPTTLLVALRTIANLWRYKHQSNNAKQIAEHASKLYDKMRLFIDDMSSIGQSLNRAQDDYSHAIKKLISGRGNLLAQAEAFRSLGVEIKHEIKSELIKQLIV